MTTQVHFQKVTIENSDGSQMEFTDVTVSVVREWADGSAHGMFDFAPGQCFMVSTFDADGGEWFGGSAGF